MGYIVMPCISRDLRERDIPPRSVLSHFLPAHIGIAVPLTDGERLRRTSVYSQGATARMGYRFEMRLPRWAPVKNSIDRDYLAVDINDRQSRGSLWRVRDYSERKKKTRRGQDRGGSP